MEQSEVETLIEELETRVDRLRALYEQYFIGIERLEPGVPRKDVERRFYVLRRTQIRNTALRFRFQNVLLRYNTYQTYWIRICRQIEEGTYKRDVRRANARFSSSLTPPPADELGLDDIEEVHDTVPPSTFELDLDLDTDDDVSFPGASAPSLPGAAPAKAGAPPRPPPPLPKSRTLKVPTTPTERHVPVGLPLVWGASQVRKDVPAQPRKPSEIPNPGRAPPVPPRPAPAPAGQRISPPPKPLARSPSSGRLRAAADADAYGGTPKKSRPLMTKVEAPRPAPAPPRPLPAPLASPPRPAPKSEGLSDERLRQIYKQYVETKRSHKESTASLTFDNLVKSLRESSNKLKEKHAGKAVDFEVAVKNGKTVLRPIVK